MLNFALINSSRYQNKFLSSSSFFSIDLCFASAEIYADAGIRFTAIQALVTSAVTLSLIT